MGILIMKEKTRSDFVEIRYEKSTTKSFDEAIESILVEAIDAAV